MDAVSYLTGKVLKSMDKKKRCGAVYIDLSKALDTIQHDMLLQKLDRLGIRGITQNWVKSYLQNRSARVKCKTNQGSQLSETRTINIGCPQGSILGPLLFACSIIDIGLNLEFCEYISYADDTTIFCIDKTDSLVKVSLEHDIYILSEWFKANKLKMNAKKTQFQMFGSKTATHKIHIEDAFIVN